METIGEKISNIRKQKGLTQEHLAESAKLNLRTIQRIENNETEPRGTTLQFICSALSISTEDIMDYRKVEDNQYLSFFHLSVLAHLIFPLGNVILPVILWQTKKDKIASLHERALNMINFQIVCSGLVAVLVIFGAFCKIMRYMDISSIMYVVLLFYVINIILPVLFSYSIKPGFKTTYYPNIIRILK